MAAPSKSSPKDAQVMSAILKDLGATEYEPRIINQMLEYTFRYVTDIFDDAKVYSSHANRKNIDLDDIKLAVQMKTEHSFTNPPPRDLLMELARQKNSQPLPLIKPYCGPRLPPDRYCLAQPSYKLKARPKPRSVPYNIHVGQRLGMNQVGKSGGPNLAVIAPPHAPSPSLAPTLNKPPPKPTVRITPAPLAGTRIISAGSKTPLTPLTPLTPSSNIGSLKRKREDDDDYDNL